MAAGATSAQAATTWSPCLYAQQPIDCANYELPLDRTGAVPGITTVRAIRMAAAEGPRMGTLFVIAGGPGQTAQVMLGLMSEAFYGANRYDVIAVDQRGSGASEPLNCPRIESGAFRWMDGDPRSDRPFTDCSVSLGNQRFAYNTAEAVADLDDIRNDLGIARASFFGVSYGTKVALAYAQAHPANTKSLLLDSVLPTDMPGAFDVDSIAAARGALRRICSGSHCRGIGDSPVSSLARLASRLERRPLETFLALPGGRVSESRIDAKALNDILFSADLNPFIYNQFPSMLTGSLGGDNAQLERLWAIINGAIGESETFAQAKRIAKSYPGKRGPATKPVHKPGDRIVGRDALQLAFFSNTTFLATTCADFDPPWTRGTDVSNRQPAIEAAADAIPNSQFYPFSRATVRDNSTASYCRGWQQNPTLPAIVQGPMPDVPTLALQGDLDTRTPTSWGERAVAGNPNAQLVRIPNSGHSVVGTDISGCALSLAKRFLIFGATDGKCRETAPAIPIAPRPATSLNGVRALSGSCRGLRGRECTRAKQTLTAGYLAVRDSLDQSLIGGADIGIGLRSGNWEVEYDISDMLTLIVVGMRLTGVSNVPGVYVSGLLNLDDVPRVDSSLRIGGWRVNLSGRVNYDRAGDSLTLSGRRGRARVSVHVRPGTSSRSATPVTAKRLSLRRNYALATSPPPGTIGR